MDCRQFRKQHAHFIDDTLPGVATWAMREHLTQCPVCSRLDSQLRRALVMVRNAPALEPSPEFRQRLAARLAAERLAGPRRQATGTWVRRVPGLAAAGVLVAIGVTASARMYVRTLPQVSLVSAPVVVSPPALPSEPVAAPAVFATVTSSLPVYPAMLLAQRASEQFAATHARTISFQAER
jgi:hypothetical protein